ncbi:MAG: ParA family protein [Ilumatobacter sp.]|nr:ParA family protein [Ilumatobacter sp.]
MKVIAFINRKGGVGKTSTAIGVADGLVRRGAAVGVIDTDSNASAARWLETVAELDVTTSTPGKLAQTLAAVESAYDAVIVDTPPNDEKAISAAAAAADLAVIPLTPTGLEVDQLSDTVELLNAAGVEWVVAPVRVRMGTNSGKEIERMLTGAGIPTTSAMVVLSESVAQSMHRRPPPMSFAALTTEIAELAGINIEGEKS